MCPPGAQAFWKYLIRAVRQIRQRRQHARQLVGADLRGLQVAAHLGARLLVLPERRRRLLDQLLHLRGDLHGAHQSEVGVSECAKFEHYGTTPYHVAHIRSCQLGDGNGCVCLERT